MKAHLSTRIRPNSEAAPWVIEEVRQLEAEVERLRDVVRQVHALAEKTMLDAWCVGIGRETLREIHKITKGMVE